ncbi:MAG: hypothetical protein GYB67_02795 [Chloroflexi bacterium]|nr:hypothetical protein [Chloroflexota bacterium]
MRRLTLISIVLIGAAWLVGCDPLAPIPTPTAQTIIVTRAPSATPLASDTPEPSPLPSFTPEPTLTATPPPLPCLDEGGQVLPFDDFRSAVAGENLRYRVYVPPCYIESQQRFPLVILLHGQAETELQWTQLGLVDALEQGQSLGVLGPMIVVLPYWGNIGNRNVFPPENSYETVIMNELLPAVERDFCVWENRQYRAIGGISRGGFWAYSIGMRHPETFGRVGGHSAAFDPDNAPAANNPLDLALNAPFLQEANLRMYVDYGTEDPAGENLDTFSSRLSARGIPHTLVINPVGGHDSDYWSAHLGEYLTFYADGWPRDLEPLPSCLEPSP